MKTLQNKKVFVDKYSKEIQGKAFELGFTWGGELGKTVSYTEKPFLFFYNDKNITCTDYFDTFSSQPFETITAEEILAMEVPKKKETFEPFQKVIVRDVDGENWQAGLFSHIVKDQSTIYYHAAGFVYCQCLDYETHKHLLGTNNNP